MSISPHIRRGHSLNFTDGLYAMFDDHYRDLVDVSLYCSTVSMTYPRGGIAAESHDRARSGEIDVTETEQATTPEANVRGAAGLSGWRNLGIRCMTRILTVGQENSP
jgi:hypothetical protein